MKFLELVKQRQSVRRYLPDPVEQEKISRCLEAARLAPSASNSQPWSFIVITDPVLKDKVAYQTYNNVLSFNKFALQAPVLVVFVIEKPRIITQIGGAIKNKEFPLIDIGITAEHFCLQAAEEGLGTCMLGWFNEGPIKNLLNIPKQKNIGLIVTVGYPPADYKIRNKSRKEMQETVFYDYYKNRRKIDS